MLDRRSPETTRPYDPLRFADAESSAWRRRYLRRLVSGIVILVLLAVPAAVHSHKAMGTLMNHPADWVPDTLPEKAAFNRFIDRFDVAGLVMVSWEGARMGSPELSAVTQIIRLLTVESAEDQRDHGDGATDRRGRLVNDADIRKALPAELKLDALRRDKVRLIINGLLRDMPEQQVVSTDAYDDPRYPLIFVRSGEETLQRMMDAPANFPRRAALLRLRGSIVGDSDSAQSGSELTCVLMGLTEAGSIQRRRFLSQLSEMVAVVIGADDPSEVVMVGGPVDGATVDEASIRSIRLFAPPSAIVAAMLCLFCLRSIPLTVVIVAVAVICEGLMMAMVYYTGTPMNAVLIVLPPLVFVLTVSSGIHLSNYYLDVIDEFGDLTPAMAARRAMRAGTTPCLLAVGTTVVGLGSLMLVRLEPIRVFGFVASIGVAVSLLLLLWCLPGAMVLSPYRGPRPPGVSPAARGMRRVRRGFQTFLRSRLMRPWPIIIGFGLMTVATSMGLSQLQSSVSVPRMFLPDSQLRQHHAWFESRIGPTVTGDLLVTFPAPDGAGDESLTPDPIDQLRVVQSLHRATMDDQRVGSVLSAASFIPPVGRGSGLASATSRSVARSLIRDPESSLVDLGFLSHTPEDLVWRLSFRLPQQVDADYGSDLGRIERMAQQTLASAVADAGIESGMAQKIDVTLTGQVSIVHKAQEVMLHDLFRSFLAAFAVVGVVMIVVLKSFIGGAIAMIPNLFPTVTCFGLMGLLREPLDIGSVMSASVALGIAVDDTVHLLSRFGSRRSRGLGRLRSAFGALDQCGWAMVQTTLVCGLSLMVYWFSHFVPTSHFAVLMFCLLTSALIGDVFLLPAIMSSALGRFLSRSIGSDPRAALVREESDDPSRSQPEPAHVELPVHSDSHRVPVTGVRR